MSQEENTHLSSEVPHDDGIALAEQIAKESEFGSRQMSGNTKMFIALLAGGWSLFQLSLPKFFLLSALYTRTISPGFLLLPLVYLSYPAFKKRHFRRHPFIFNSANKASPSLTGSWHLSGAFAALYLALDYIGISARQGVPLTRDIVIGIILVVLLLEAARRSIGPALSVVATFVHFLCPLRHEPDHPRDDANQAGLAVSTAGPAYSVHRGHLWRSPRCSGLCRLFICLIRGDA